MLTFIYPIIYSCRSFGVVPTRLETWGDLCVSIAVLRTNLQSGSRFRGDAAASVDMRCGSARMFQSSFCLLAANECNRE